VFGGDHRETQRPSQARCLCHKFYFSKVNTI
jgi:hypothetical protein